MDGSSDPLLASVARLSARVDSQPLWVQGTVTSASPLRVRLDGDSTALAGTPDRLVSPRVGERVQCVRLSRGRLLVVGVSGGQERPAGSVLRSSLSLQGSQPIALVSSYGSEPFGRKGGISHANGLFTVPVTGVYWVTMRVTSVDSPGASHLWLQTQVRGSWYGAVSQWRNDWAGDTFEASQGIALSSGDTVGMGIRNTAASTTTQIVTNLFLSIFRID